MDHIDTNKRTSPLLIAAAWLVVMIPAGWGLRYTVQNALKIFAQPAASAPATSAAPSTAVH
ncbi:MAG: hypothetical protein NVSMB3_10660 [Acidobacteriaceae bacterium]